MGLLLAASLVELHLRMGDLLIALPRDFAIAAGRLLPVQAAWATASVSLVALLRWRLPRVRALGWASLALVAAVDAAIRQILGEAWLGALQDSGLAASVLPGLVYFGLAPALAGGALLGLLVLLPRRAGVAVACVALALLGACALSPPLAGLREAGAAAPSAPGPNLLLVTIDTWRHDHLSAAPLAVDPALTPSIDALARRGVIFSEARAHAPLTVPSHVSILSGRSPWEHRVLTNGGKVAPDLPWLPQRLALAGWHTGAVVSGAVIRGSRGFARGFDSFHDDMREPPRVDDLVGLRLLGLLRGRKEVRAFRAEAPRAVLRAEAFLARSPADRPWFLWVHLYDVHQPHTVADRRVQPFLPRARQGLPDPCAYRDHPNPLSGPGGLGIGLGPSRAEERERRCRRNDALDLRLARYRAEVAVADEAVGRIVEILRTRGEIERTVVVVTADHGESLTEHGTHLEHQFVAYESALRVPAVVVPSGGVPARQSSALVQHRDLSATIAALLGLPPGEGTDWLRQDAGPRPVASVVHAPPLAMTRAMRRRGEPGIAGPGRAAPIRVAVRDGQDSLVLTPGLPDEVYDLRADPHQVHDLASTQGVVAPGSLTGVAAEVVGALEQTTPERLDPGDPDLDALRALGYVE